MSTALILSGGGARAAYQAGVLRGLLEVHGGDGLPFEVVCGTSAGAINAAFLAAVADRPREGIERLCAAWSSLHPNDVYDYSWRTVLGNLGKILVASLGFGERSMPAAVLDILPLRHLLSGWIDFEALHRNVADGMLQTLCITAMDYCSGNSVAFYEGGDVQPWERRYRRGESTLLGLDHVMASAAIPILFPAQRIDTRYFGDGALRQLYPISPALRCGATRLLVVGVVAPFDPSPTLCERRRPSIGQMAAHLLDRAFIDYLEVDIELAQRFNRVASVLSAAERERMNVEPIDTLVITPSEHFHEVAMGYRQLQPRTVQLLQRVLGTTTRGAGASFTSYLMFDGRFCEHLMDIGYRDVLAERGRVSDFFAAGLNPPR